MQLKKKTYTTAIITILTLSILLTALQIQPASASTAITNLVNFEEQGTCTVEWMTEKVYSGAYSVKLVSGGAWDNALVKVYYGDYLNTITVDDFTYYYSTVKAQNSWGVLYLDTTGDGLVDAKLFSMRTEQEIHTGVWTKTTQLDTWKLYLPDSEGRFSDTGKQGTLEQWQDGTTPSGYAELGTAELVYVAAAYGTSDPGLSWVIYIDDFEIKGEVYELEPQTLTVDTTYDITINTNLLVPTPVTVKLKDIDETVLWEGTTNPAGRINFYDITPEYAGDNTIYDPNGETPTDPKFITASWISPGNPDFATRCDFLVEPAEDYTVTVAPTSLDVHEGTVALTVTVTNASGPVKGAYVTAQFRDNEAIQVNDENTHNLRGIRIKTLSDGTVKFDIEVPDVAGTIMVFAGNDYGPNTDFIYDHWGYTTIPVASIPFLDITVSPDSYLKGIPLDLTIKLWNKDATKDILKASRTSKAVNITLEGTDMRGDAITSGVRFTVESYDYYAGAWTRGVTPATPFANVEILRIVGKCEDTDFGIDKEAEVGITNFKSDEAGTITVTALSDIGGAHASIDTIALPSDPDGKADYIETAAATITVATPAALNIVKVTTYPVLLKVRFADLPDKTFQAIKTDTTIQLKVYDAEGNEYTDTGDYKLTADNFVLIGVKFAKDPDISYDTGRWVITIYPLESGNIIVTVTHDTAIGSAEYKNYGLKASVTPAQFTNTTAYYDVNVTLTTFEGLPISTAKVQLQQKDTILTQHLTTDVPAYLEGVRPGDPSGLYRFFNVTSVQVGTEWDDAIQVVVGIDLASAVGDYTLVGPNFGGDMITVTYDVLDVALDRGNVTALIDQNVVVTVTEDTTPIVGANVYVEGCGYIPPADIGTTDAEGKLTFAFDGQIGTIPGTMTIRAVTADLTKTGSTTLTVLRPDAKLYNLTVNGHISDYITAGLKAYIYNMTILDGDGNEIVSEDHTVTTGSDVGIYLNVTSYDLVASEEASIDKILHAILGVVKARIDEGASCAAYEPLEYFVEISVADENADGNKAGNTLSVLNITVMRPIVSNTTYTGTWITYTGYVGQTGTFYVKVSDADGVVVEGATVAIDGTTASGVTDAAGEVTLAWMPMTTGTYDIRLNEVLNIGTITVVPYVAPQLVISYTPEIVYLDSTVTVAVTADEAPVAGVSVTIVDPDGISTSRTTTIAGTCTFTADKLEYWSVGASKTGYTDAEPVSIEVLAGVPPPLPAEVSEQETLDFTGAPKTSFALGETVVVSAEVTNVGIESQPMLIVVQLVDPDLRALAPTFGGVTLDPGESFVYAPGFILPLTGYAAGTWTAKIMVLDTWPALGGVPIAEPVTVTFTVTS